MKGIFDDHVLLLHKSLDFRSRRNNLLASNIANMETPGYRAKDLVFERALGKAMNVDVPGPLQVTHTRHLNGNPATPLSLVQPKTINTSNPVGNVDGNSVDLERETTKLSENQIVYRSLTRLLTHKFSQLNSAIREGSF